MLAPRVFSILTFVLTTLASMCGDPASAHAERASSSPLDPVSDDDRGQIVSRARGELTRVTKYSGEWMATSGYPMGDIPSSRGACTDLVVRAFRAGGIDLQKLVHEDVVVNPDAYGIVAPDPHIDHRRVAVLHTWFKRNARVGLSLDPTTPGAFVAGDVVFFAPTKTTPLGHVAIVSDRIGPRGLPLLLENGGPRPAESDNLDAGQIVGHFRAGLLLVSQARTRSA
jgi:uncharacterized protein